MGAAVRGASCAQVCGEEEELLEALLEETQEGWFLGCQHTHVLWRLREKIRGTRRMWSAAIWWGPFQEPQRPVSPLWDSCLAALREQDVFVLNRRHRCHEEGQRRRLVVEGLQRQRHATFLISHEGEGPVGTQNYLRAQ